MADMIFNEDGLLDEPCLSCDKPYIEDIWNEWCCDEKVCPHRVKNEDKCMQEIQEIEVKTTLYVTEDGKRFNNLESAQEHKKHLKALETLNSFKLDGPNYNPFDAYGCDWQWYKVHDLDELRHVLRLAAEVYAMENCSDDDDFNYVESRFYNNLNTTYYLLYRDMNSEHGRNLFPKYIAISFECEGFNIFNTLDNIERKHKYEMKKWEKFYQAFKNELKKDMESDDCCRGAQNGPLPKQNLSNDDTIDDIIDQMKKEFIDLYPKNYMGGLDLDGCCCEFSLNQVLKILDKYKSGSEG